MSEPRTGVATDERTWQEELGGHLQEEAYARAGTHEVLDRQHGRIAALLAATPDMRILDLGCGVGHLLGWLTRHAPAHYHGLDLSLNSVRAARAATDGCHFGVADAAQLPFRAVSFDGVVCHGAAHHFPDFPAVLREVRRVLAPGGRLVLHEPADSPLARVVRRTLFRHSRYESPADLSHKHAFTRGVVEGALRDAGFTDIVVAAHDFLAYPLSGMYLPLPWSRSRAVMRALIGVERRLDAVGFLRPVWDAVSWSTVFTARRPR